MILSIPHAMRLIKDGRASIDAKVQENGIEWWYVRRHDAYMGGVNRIDIVKIKLKTKMESP